MPHDRDGQVVNPGDHVTIEFVVQHVHQVEEFCNVQLRSVEKMPGNDAHIDLSAVNTRQVVKI